MSYGLGALSSTRNIGRLAGDGNSIIFFHAKWCGFCPAAQSVVDSLVSQGANIQTVDIDDQPDLASQYGIHSIPAFVVLNSGQWDGSVHTGGASSSQLWSWLGSSPSSATSSAPPSVTYSSGSTDDWGSPPDSSGGWSKVKLNGDATWKKGSQFIKAGSGDATPYSAPSSAPVISDDTPAKQTFQMPAPAAAASFFDPAPAPAAAATVVAQVNVTADPNSWGYILQHKNATWEAVLLDGAHAFRNKRTGKFAPGESIKGLSGMNMSGLAMAGVHGLLGVVTLPVKSYTTKSSSPWGTVALVGAGIVGVGLLGWLAYRAVK